MAFGQPLPGEALVQIAMMGGDYDKCIAWAIKVGLEKGVPQVVTEVPWTMRHWVRSLSIMASRQPQSCRS